MGCRSCGGGARYNPNQPIPTNRVPSGRFRIPRPPVAPVTPPVSAPNGAATPAPNTPK